MFYTNIQNRHWNQRKLPVNQIFSTSKQLEVEDIQAKNYQLAQAKTAESISNTQRVYYLERRLFG
ncbi:hypothetical protein ACX27_15845 [Nostoc piscinale CENA21]|uniref:Uncharacterized protein n=1 Tax=Nostoc piscinale CENA21 TaxID=224013 RepID=A0A0M3V5N9_9NOSO|nr:hypothetical protein [Nostoc piscinale]ALF53997.1 hypothetical protein ACX27_15845 [Nostoc piscinale CENA21]